MEGKGIDILTKAIETFGVEPQIDMAIEECSELINALCKWRRKRVDDPEVITEIADVRIMMTQMAMIFGWEEVEAEEQRKLERLGRRINKKNINEK